jgi:hypothetical protein
MAPSAMATSFIFLLFLSGQKGPLIPVTIDMDRQTDPSFQLLKNFVPRWRLYGETKTTTKHYL